MSSPPGRNNLSKTRFWVQLQKFIDIFHLFVPTTWSLSHCLGLKGLTWDLYYAVCWGRLRSIWQVASSPCQGEEKAPCLCGIHSLSPRGLCHPYFASRNLRTAKPEPYREHSWAGPTGALLCFLGQPSSRPHTSNTYMHTCRTGNLGAPGQSQGPSVSSMVLGLHSCSSSPV